jgi:hypothetical protein
MKKLVILTLCFVLLLSAMSFATKTRVRTMGENNEILLDEANIWIYPSRLFDYPDVAVGDFNSEYYYYPFKDAEQFDGNSFYSTSLAYTGNSARTNRLFWERTCTIRLVTTTAKRT